MTPKLGAIAALVVAAGSLGWIAFGNLGENLVYYWSPTEMIAAGDAARGATIRLGGQVEPGSVKKTGTTLSFEVSDGQSKVHVATEAIPPQMFREGIGVVVEGTVNEAGVFETRRLLVKHDNEYRAPTAGETPTGEEMYSTVAGQ